MDLLNTALKRLSTGSMVFVTEFSTYAKDFTADPTPVAVTNISSCTLIEITNIDSSGNRTVFSLTHFTYGQLTLEPMIERNCQVVLDNFTARGGKLETATVRIFGGAFYKAAYPERRDNLKKQLQRLLPVGVLIGEPKGHHVSNPRQLISYVFRRENLTWCYQREENDVSKDVYSGNISTEKQKARYHNQLDAAYIPVQKVLEKQTSNNVKFSAAVLKKTEEGQPIELATLMRCLGICVVGDDGKIGPHNRSRPLSGVDANTVVNFVARS